MCEKKKKKKKTKKINDFLKAYTCVFQEQLARFTSDLICVLSRYASACTANLLLFDQETTELQTRVA